MQRAGRNGSGLITAGMKLQAKVRSQKIQAADAFAVSSTG
ncbi:hypothetical protein SAMN05216299_11610 [Nitrosospira sp. Nsp14]|nr:hypothetical protein SAMN05216299_11610 [Nitrosospira sp. Nsp14]